MILDAQNLFCENQAVTTTANATNDIDLGPIAGANTQRDLGASNGLYLEVDCPAAAAGAGTLTISLITDTTSAFAASTTLWQSAAIPVANLTAGARLALFKLPSTVQKYLRVVFTVTSGPFTGGQFSAYLTLDPQDNVSYAPGYSFPAGA